MGLSFLKYALFVPLIMTRIGEGVYEVVFFCRSSWRLHLRAICLAGGWRLFFSILAGSFESIAGKGGTAFDTIVENGRNTQV